MNSYSTRKKNQVSSESNLINKINSKLSFKTVLLNKIATYLTSEREILNEMKKEIKENKKQYNLKLKEYNEILQRIDKEEQQLNILNDELSLIDYDNCLFYQSIDKQFYNNFKLALNDPSVNKLGLKEIFNFTNFLSKPFFNIKKMIKDEVDLKSLLDYSTKINSKTEETENKLYYSFIDKIEKETNDYNNLEFLESSCSYPINEIVKFIKKHHKSKEIEYQIELIESNNQNILYVEKNNSFLKLKEFENIITSKENEYNRFKDAIVSFSNIIEDDNDELCNIIKERLKRWEQIYWKTNIIEDAEAEVKKEELDNKHKITHLLTKRSDKKRKSFNEGRYNNIYNKSKEDLTDKFNSFKLNTTNLEETNKEEETGQDWLQNEPWTQWTRRILRRRRQGDQIWRNFATLAKC